MQKKAEQKKGTSIKRLFLIFCAITVLIIGFVVAKTAGPKTWHAILEMRSAYLLLAFVLGSGMILLNAVIVRLLVKAAAGMKIGFLYSIETILSYYFLSSISPTATGGEPLMIYMLTTKGVPFGKALSVALIRGFLVLLLIVIGAPAVIFFRGELVQNEHLRRFFYLIAVIIVMAVITLIYAFYKPRKVEKVIHKIRMKMSKCKLFSKYALSLEKKLDVWIEDFVKCMKNFMRYQKKTVLAVVVLTLLALAMNYLIAYAILAGLGFYISPLDVIMIQFVLYFFLYFTPTPGGSGVAEGGSYLMFSAYVPTHILGVFVVLWRFFTAYLWLILGGIFITRSIGLNIVEKIPSDIMAEPVHEDLK